MKDLQWYAVQRHVLHKAMKGVVLEEVSSDSIRYHRPRSTPLTIPKPPEDELYLYLYGSMLMDGYTIAPSPDGEVHLCGGGTAVYSVTNTSCTCAACTYSREGTPCKHMNMLRGHEIYRLRAMALRARALDA